MAELALDVNGSGLEELAMGIVAAMVDSASRPIRAKFPTIIMTPNARCALT